MGIISTKELTERHIVTEVAKGIQRNEVLVNDLMISRSDLHAFDYNELQNSQVSDVVNALKKIIDYVIA